MKTRKIHIVFLAMILCMGLFLLSGCGQAENFAEYMKGEPAMRSAIDTQLNILSPEAKASVQYTEDTAEVTVTYYALTQAEIEGLEAEKTARRCSVILQDAMTQYEKDTGKKAGLQVMIYGHDVEKK